MKNLKRRIAAMLSLTLVLAIIPLPSFAAPSPVAALAVIAPAAIPSVDLKCVTMVTDTLAYAAGAGGTIIKTTDGGESWVSLATGTTTADFRGIAFWDANNGIAVTYNRAVYKTTNGGMYWEVVTPDATQFAPIGVNAVSVVPAVPNAAVLVGGDPNSVDDTQLPGQAWMAWSGGAYWGQQAILQDRRHAVVIGEDPVLIGESELLDIDFFDSQRGWVVGDDYYTADATAPVYATTNGGANWALQTINLPIRLTGVSFGSATAGVVVSSEGRVFSTANGGSAWTEGTSPVISSINGVDMTSGANGWAAGAGGTLLRTTDGGLSWMLATSNTSQNLAAIALSGSRGIAVGAGGTVIVTSDGATWHTPGNGGGGDTTAPTMTSLSSATHPVEATWYSQANAGFTWAASDAVGVAGYSYVLDSSASTLPDEISEGSATTTSVVAPEGLRYFHVRAVDAAGNWSTAVHRAVRTDRTKPTTTDNHVASYSGSANITLTPVDQPLLSGIQKTEWSINGAALQTGTIVPVLTTGDITLTYASTDNAGNRETTQTATFTVVPSPVDANPPVMMSLTSSTHPVEANWYSQASATFTWHAVDTSGVAGYSYVLDSSAGTLPDEISEGSAETTTIAAPVGVRYFHVRAVDAAGNWSDPFHRAIHTDLTPTEVPAIPVEGTSRYLTAIAASQLAFPGGAPAVVIATGTNWPDALGGAALAGEVGGPILLTDPNTLPSAVRAEITRLGATTVYILGSDAAVSNVVAAAVDGITGVTVKRLEGSNRYATARAIATEVVTLQGGGKARTFFVATGTNFPDALAASPLAAKKGWPLFLVGASGLSASDLAYMKANGDSAIILGSTGAVAASVETQLNTTFGNTKVERLEGGDRYATGLDIVRYATSPAGGLTWATPAVATGTNFPDALSGGVLQGLDGSILLLTNGTTLTPSVGAAITAHEAEITEVRYLGSTSAVSVAVRNAIQAIVN